MIAITVGLLVGGWALFVVLGDSWWQLFLAVLLAAVFTQIGFIGHDAGHSQIFQTAGPTTSSAWCTAISRSVSATAGGSTSTTAVELITPSRLLE